MIFCVEDDTGIRELMLYTLRASGFEAEGYADGNELFDALNRKIPQMILLDIMLPGEDGLSILKKLRAQTATADIPIIMASAKGTEFDKITGLDSGADDYLAKPFGMMEMVSHIKAVLRRYTPKTDNIITIGALSLNRTGHSVFVSGKSVPLTLKEYDLLEKLMTCTGQVFSRDQLLQSVWGMDFIGETRTVDVHVGTLRAKLGPCGDYIETVRGVGYKMRSKP